MEQLMAFVQQHSELAPFIVFGLMLLMGLNVPVPEDGMVFISAVMAAKDPTLLWPLFIACLSGAYLSDLICYTLGRMLGPKLWNISWFAKMVKQEKVAKISAFYERYGMLTLLIGRFIPGGVRNGLFLTAGLGQMPVIKFALSDGLACFISVTTYFYLYFHYGESVVAAIKQGNKIILIGAILFAAFLLCQHWLKKNRTRVVNNEAAREKASATADN